METKNLLKSLKHRLSGMLCLVALLLTSQVMYAYDYNNKTLYFDNSKIKWTNCYAGIGNNGALYFYKMSRVSGTQYLYSYTISGWGDAGAFMVANTSWSSQSCFWKIVWIGSKNSTVPNTSDISSSNVYSAGTGTQTYTADNKSETLYSWNSSASYGPHNVTISDGTGGSTTVKDYDNNSVSNGNTKPYLTVLKITVSANSGYTIKSVKVNNTDYTTSAKSGTFNYTMTGATTIATEFDCIPSAYSLGGYLNGKDKTAYDSDESFAFVSQGDGTYKLTRSFTTADNYFQVYDNCGNKYGVNTYTENNPATLVKDGNEKVGAKGLTTGANYNITWNSSTKQIGWAKACTPPTITGHTDGSRCGAGIVTLSATASAGDVKWYASSTGGDALYTGDSYTTTSISKNTTYYAEANDNGCVSTSRTAVAATVNSIPTITANDNSICGAGDVTLTATPSSGASVDWYDSSTGGNKVAESTTSLTVQGVTAGSSVTRYAEAVKNNCKSSSRATAVATAKLIPAVSNIALTGSGECGTGDVTFTATATASSTVTWYDGSTSKGTDNPITINIAGGSSKTLTAKATLNGCEESTGMSEEGSRKPAPIISATPNNTTAYEVITLESTSGSVLWSKDAADTKAYFVKDNQAVDGDTVEGENVNFKAPAKVGSYAVTAKDSNNCTSNLSITISEPQEVCN